MLDYCLLLETNSICPIDKIVFITTKNFCMGQFALCSCVHKCRILLTVTVRKGVPLNTLFKGINLIIVKTASMWKPPENNQ